jgi:hypothetical protein
MEAARQLDEGVWVQSLVEATLVEGGSWEFAGIGRELGLEYQKVGSFFTVWLSI